MNEEADNECLLARDRTKKIIKPPQRLGYTYLIVFSLISSLISASEVLDEESKDYKEVMRSWDKTEWLRSMDDEMKLLHDINTWELIKRHTWSN